MKKRARESWLLLATLSLFGCAEPGESGSEAIDCGDHGAAHDGHCHCDQGYLFDGETCTSPDAITDVCGAHDAGAAPLEHHHEACRCPASGECPCEGQTTTIGGASFCTPDIGHE